MRELDAVIFDKTGTLSEGEHGVVGTATVDGIDETRSASFPNRTLSGNFEEDEVLALAAAVEGDSEHVIARAIREAAAEMGVSVSDATDFDALKGRGVHGTVNGETVYVGGPNLLD